ncbi:MAG TPA: peptidylprolyl isomerase [Pyrinomonadaceae bacterium]|jgi:peptidyl-prolyl cis-trans isomerase B (cyclophilin B)
MRFVKALAVSLLFYTLVSNLSLQAQTATPSPSPQPSPATAASASPSPAPSPNASPSPSPQKANRRPQDNSGSPAEPFDQATVERMAGQCVTLETERGSILLEMLPEAAPETVRNFLNLSATGAFDTTTFSRVVPDFVVQGGNLSTRQNISMEHVRRSRRTIPDEPSYIRHLRGIVSMARPEQANSATTHFFILVSDSPHLDGTFTAFARVLAGMELVDRINHEPVNGDKPANPVRLTRAVVAACPPKGVPVNK